ncbi:F-box domain-containing protein [Artemisia annua]|uniref:F-box domain-containing protein n=1 Tax=Artemisia annua TaxID=35608 RepID=A0A2U1PG08_ARTAN|nr:F-box domain-containing protein [Artemisia annua]
MRFVSYIALGLALKHVFTVFGDLTEKETTTSELPSNIILMEILPRLPTKLLGRCMCVCKEWKSFLPTPKFAKMHHQYVSGYKLFQIDHSNDSRLLTLHTIDCEAPNVGSKTVRICCFDLSRRYGVTTVRNYSSLPYPNHVLDTVYIAASFDGLVCLAAMFTQELGFWNPLTGAFKKLAANPYSPRFYKPSYTQCHLRYSPDKIGMPPSSSDVIGFYIDSSDDYKLLHMVSNGALGAYVYSLRMDSWRKIEYLVENADCISNYHWSPATFWGQNLYFVVLDSSGDQRCIICFNVQSEKFRKIQFPPIKKYTSSDFTASLVVRDGCIHLCVCYIRSQRLSLLEGGTWRMHDNDVWLKVKAFFNVKDDWMVRSLVCMTRNENWLAIGQENDSFKKIDFEDFATSHSCLCNEGWVSNFGQTSTIYHETLVSL